MNLLSINIPNMTSTQFANLESKNKWEPKIQLAGQFYPQIEYLTVKHGVRKTMIAHNVKPENIQKMSRDLAKDGLMMIPLSREGVSNGSFSHFSKSYDGRGDFVYRSVIAKNIADAYDFVQAHETHDDVRIGELLGFPQCCSTFFDRVWKLGYFDPIWQQAENTPKAHIKNIRNFEDRRLVRIKESAEAYKTLSTFRYLGVRVLSHFPCSFNCERSIQVANEWIDLGRKLNLTGLNETLEIMQLPFEWDCLKGVAIINTPVFKIVTNSMPCYPRHVIQQESSIYPEESPTGIQFPWIPKMSC
jgi:hypothetical protein